MKQKCVQFHTIKSYYNTLKILKKEGFEIVFADRFCRLDLNLLTIEEQISWLETIEKDNKPMDKTLKKYAEDIENTFQSLIGFRKLTKNLIKSYRANPSSFETSKKYEQFIKTRDELRTKIDVQSLFFWWNDNMTLHRGIRCSCIVAKKGTSLVRYLSFQADPIVTLFTTSKNLKSSLEKKF